MHVKCAFGGCVLKVQLAIRNAKKHFRFDDEQNSQACSQERNCKVQYRNEGMRHTADLCLFPPTQAR